MNSYKTAIRSLCSLLGYDWPKHTLFLEGDTVEELVHSLELATARSERVNPSGLGSADLFTHEANNSEHVLHLGPVRLSCGTWVNGLFKDDGGLIGMGHFGETALRILLREQSAICYANTPMEFPPELYRLAMALLSDLADTGIRIDIAKCKL